MKPLRTITTEKEIIDIKGWTIKKGSELFIMKDDLPKHPSLGYRLMVVKVNNGTDDYELCPETCIKDTDLK
jgi:hypothetical protein